MLEARFTHSCTVLPYSTLGLRSRVGVGVDESCTSTKIPRSRRIALRQHSWHASEDLWPKKLSKNLPRRLRHRRRQSACSAPTSFTALAIARGVADSLVPSQKVLSIFGTEEMSHPGFFEDRAGAYSDSDEEEKQPQEKAKESGQAAEASPKCSGRRRPVWVDEDDDERLVNISGVKRRRKLRRALGEENVSGAEYTQRIRELYSTKVVTGASGPGAWAQLPSERRRKNDDEDNEDSQTDQGDSDDDLEQSNDVKNLLQSTSKLLSSVKRSASGGAYQEQLPLKSGNLSVRRVTNANEEDPNKSEARCVEFHPSGSLLLTAGLDKTLRIFQVDGEYNAKVQGVHVKNFPIHTAKFTGGGTQVVMAGRKRFFHQLDMNTGAISTLQTLATHEERSWEKFEVSADGTKLAFLGQQGKIVILANKTKREIGQIRLNGRVSTVSFAAEGGNENHMYATSVDGTVYLWDTRRMSCIDKHKDEGAIHSTSLATSAAHYALGSDSGIVNVYSSTMMRSTPSQGFTFGIRTQKPKKSFFNLTTSIDNIAFNSDGKLMAFSSHEKKNAVKVAHIPSMTVYSNWPSARSNVRRVCCLKFSPRSGYLAIGNDKGDVQLMRLDAYPAA